MSQINYSFIIPHHNNPVLLDRCLNSIPERDDIEIIVIDDNSDVGKKPRCKRKDITFIFLDSESSKGAGRARNVGIASSHGKWLLFADCDDFYESGFISKLDEYVDSSIDVLYFNIHFSYNVELKKCMVKYNAEKYLYLYLRNKTLYRNITNMKHANNASWNIMVRRQFVVDKKICFDEIPKCNDAFFKHSVGLLAGTNVDAIPDRLYYWVYNDGSITHRALNPEQKREVVGIDRRVNALRIQDDAWETVPTFYHGFVGRLKREGVKCAIRFLIRSLMNGTPWLQIWYHLIIIKLCRKNK